MNTIAGDDTSGYSGNGGAATSAELADYVGDATVDASGNLYIADTDNDVVRFVPKTTGTYYGQSMTADVIYVIAGAGWGSTFTTGDGGVSLDGEFGWVLSVTPDNAGGFYIDDQTTNRIRHVSVGDTSGPEAETTFTYDSDGEQTGVTAPDGNLSGANAANYTTAYTYNYDGEVTVSTQGGGMGATVTARTVNYGYDHDGNQTRSKTPAVTPRSRASTPTTSRRWSPTPSAMPPHAHLLRRGRQRGRDGAPGRGGGRLAHRLFVPDLLPERLRRPLGHRCHHVRLRRPGQQDDGDHTGAGRPVGT